MKAFLPSIVFLIALFSFSGCQDKNENFNLASASDYIPTPPGKYMIYRVDSTVFAQQGRKEETHTYQEKDVIDAQITDAIGRPSYRVYRYLRDSAGQQGWASLGTYLITPTKGTVETIDNNLRVIKLISPVQEGKTWKGNRFVGPEPYSAFYQFGNDDNMGDWDFTIGKTGESLLLNGKTYTDVVTVTQIDESLNVPLTNPNSFASRSLSVEKYAKGIGMIFQNYILWEYQPNPNGTPYKIGFGIKRTILDHN